MSAAETVRLTADVVLLGHGGGRRWVLLIARAHPPFEGRWALPGGHVDPGEDTVVAARRELAEETGLLVGDPDLTRVGVYAAPGRDPRGRYVTFAYTATLSELLPPTAGDDAKTARWWPMAEVLASPERLAFDHHEVISDAARMTAPEPSTGTQGLAERVARTSPAFVALADTIGPLFSAIALRFQAAETDGFCDHIQDYPRTDLRRVAGLREAATAMRNFADSLDPPSPDRPDAEDERLQLAIQAAGLAVVELPEPDEGGQIPTWRDGSGNRWTAWNEGVEDEFDCLVEDLDRLRRTAVVILAACAASERMAAEHRGGDPR